MALNPTHIYSLIVKDRQEQTYPDVKRVFVRVNAWGNYALFIGNRKVLDGAKKVDLIERCNDIYPNAEIIDKTII